MDMVWSRAQRVLRVAALGVLLGGLGLFLAQVIPQEFEFTTAEWVKFIRQTTLGQMMLVRVGLGLLACVMLRVVRRPRIWLVGAPVIAMLAQASITRTSPLAGHADWQRRHRGRLFCICWPAHCGWVVWLPC